VTLLAQIKGQGESGAMKFLNRLSRVSWPWLLFVCSFAFFATAVFNQGFIASDEYWTGITRYIPAQTSSIATMMVEDDVKSPTQLLPMHFLAQTALALGIAHPFQQYSFVILVLGVLCTLILFAAFRRFYRDDLDQRLSVVLLGFYFGSALIFTRPMFESLSAPFVTWGALMAVRYDRTKRGSDLIWGAIAMSLAFLLRPQAGICALVLVALPLIHRRGKDFMLVSGAGLVMFVLAGLPDLWIRGSWHHSLLGLIDYNVKYGSSYGEQPAFYYLPVIFAMCFGPWFIASYNRKRLSAVYREHRTVLWMILIFVIEHTLFTHKFERFLIPILPLFLLMLVPLLRQLLEDFERRKIRVVSLVTVNLLLWVPSTFFEPQGHLIDLVLYTESHPDARLALNVDDAITWVPDVFQSRGSLGFQPVHAAELTADRICEKPLLANEWVVDELRARDGRLQIERVFLPGVIDRLAYRFNRAHNLRRAPLVLLSCGRILPEKTSN
jgi:hypothetical protein